jgi:hypothetical protein
MAKSLGPARTARGPIRFGRYMRSGHHETDFGAAEAGLGKVKKPHHWVIAVSKKKVV